MPTIDQILANFQQQESALMQKKFTLSADAAALGKQELEGLASEVQGDLGAEGADRLVHAAAQRKANELRAAYRDEYEVLYIEYQQKLENRLAEVDQALYRTARDASIEAHLQAAGMSEEKLIGVMSLALEAGHLAAGDLAMLEAERRGLDQAIAFYSEQRAVVDATWGQLWREHALGGELLANMPQSSVERFETIFGDIDRFELSQGLRSEGVSPPGYS